MASAGPGGRQKRDVLRKVFIYAIVFGVLSIIVEVALLAAGLKIPKDNAIIALVILSVSPPLSAYVSGFRKKLAIAKIWALTAILTIFLSVTFGTVHGLLAPIIIRPLSALLAVIIVSKFL